MGRAIVRNPQAFLMDEPLSNLDVKLRVQMQVSISRLQRKLGVTTVYVTHDQTEAMRLGDRVVVMRGGVVQQVGAPQELYERPVNQFVAGFIGSPAMNFLPARLEDSALRCAMGELPLPGVLRRALEAARAPRQVIIGVRPEHLEDAALGEPRAGEHGVTFTAHVEMLESLGSDKYAHLTLEDELGGGTERARPIDEENSTDVPGDTPLIARLPIASAAAPGGTVALWLDPDHLQIFDHTDGRNLTLLGGARHAQPSHYLSAGISE
jgi:multiple sugar transport system ATP-binding protein